MRSVCGILLILCVALLRGLAQGHHWSAPKTFTLIPFHLDAARRGYVQTETYTPKKKHSETGIYADLQEDSCWIEANAVPDTSRGFLYLCIEHRDARPNTLIRFCRLEPMDLCWQAIAPDTSAWYQAKAPWLDIEVQKWLFYHLLDGREDLWTGSPYNALRLTLIGVTSFFRDPKAFENLERVLKTYLARKKPGEALRCWVPGCSTGEEAYSLAIMFHHLLGEEITRYHVQIFGTDLDERAIEQARRGRFFPQHLESVPANLVQTYFDQVTEEEFQVKKAIRSSVLFSVHHLISQPPFLKLDLISCRNLLIYFDQSLQQQVIPLFHYALKPEGLLFLGKSETIGQFSELFTTLDSKNRTFRRKGTPAHLIPRLPLPRVRRPAPSQMATSAQPQVKTLEQKVKETLYQTYEHPYLLIDHDFSVREIQGDMSWFLRFPEGGMQVNLLRLIHTDLEIEVLGVITRAIKNREAQQGTPKRLHQGEQVTWVRLSVKPLLYQKDSEELYLVIFERLNLEEFFEASRAWYPQCI